MLCIILYYMYIYDMWHGHILYDSYIYILYIYIYNMHMYYSKEWSNSKHTPFVQPNPICGTYSPPPPPLPISTALKLLTKVHPTLLETSNSRKNQEPSPDLLSFMRASYPQRTTTRAQHIISHNYVCLVGDFLFNLLRVCCTISEPTNARQDPRGVNGALGRGLGAIVCSIAPSAPSAPSHVGSIACRLLACRRRLCTY